MPCRGYHAQDTGECSGAGCVRVRQTLFGFVRVWFSGVFFLRGGTQNWEFFDPDGFWVFALVFALVFDGSGAVLWFAGVIFLGGGMVRMGWTVVRSKRVIDLGRTYWVRPGAVGIMVTRADVLIAVCGCEDHSSSRIPLRS